jgi:hypothetical protein
MKSVLKFEANKQVEIALAFPQGKITPSRYGADEVMFTLDFPPEHITFLDLHAAGQLKKFDPARGERFVICKRKGAEKNSPVRWDFWLTPEAEKARAAAESGIPMKDNGRPAWGGNAPLPTYDELAARPRAPLQMPAPAPLENPTLLERQLAASLAEVENLKAANAEVERLKAAASVVRTPAPVAVAARQDQVENTSYNANGTAIGAAPRAVTMLEDALRTAIQAAHAGAAFAKSIGYVAMPQFSSEDIRAMAISTFIAMSGGKGQRQ